jgi:hypothetical protein
VVQDGPDNRDARCKGGIAEDLDVIECCVATAGWMVLCDGSAQMKDVHGYPGADDSPSEIDGRCEPVADDRNDS